MRDWYWFKVDFPDSLLEIDGYNLIRSDHPNDIKRGGGCIYFKEILPIRVINVPYPKEALLLEMNYNNKRVISVRNIPFP